MGCGSSSHDTERKQKQQQHEDITQSKQLKKQPLTCPAETKSNNNNSNNNNNNNTTAVSPHVYRWLDGLEPPRIVVTLFDSTSLNSSSRALTRRNVRLNQQELTAEDRLWVKSQLEKLHHDEQHEQSSSLSLSSSVAVGVGSLARSSSPSFLSDVVLPPDDLFVHGDVEFLESEEDDADDEVAGDKTIVLLSSSLASSTLVSGSN
eukprot:PhM_4_TR4156/c1_g1_i3/m.73969